MHLGTLLVCLPARAIEWPVRAMLNRRSAGAVRPAAAATAANGNRLAILSLTPENHGTSGFATLTAEAEPEGLASFRYGRRSMQLRMECNPAAGKWKTAASRGSEG